MKTVEKNFFCELTEEEIFDLEGGKISWAKVAKFLAKTMIVIV